MDLSLLVPASLTLIMFSMGLGLRPADFQRIAMQPLPSIVGLTCQLLLLPLVALLIALVFQMEAEMALGLLLLALCPGGVTSNLASKLAGGDIALSVTLTAVCSIVTVFTLPFALGLGANLLGLGLEQFSLPLFPAIKQLTLLTIVPLMLAMGCVQLFPKFVEQYQGNILALATAMFVLIIAATWQQQWDNITASARVMGTAVVTMNVATMLLGWLASRLASLPRREQVTLVLEVGLQNSVLAFTVAFSLVGNAMLAIPAAFYSVIMVCSALVVIFLNSGSRESSTLSTHTHD